MASAMRRMFRARALKTLTALCRYDAYDVFQDAVPDTVPMYHELIRQPMHFGEIESRIKTDDYKTVDDMERDIFLIVNNCVFFNDASTVYNQEALKLRAFALKQLRELRLDLKAKGLQQYCGICNGSMLVLAGTLPEETSTGPDGSPRRHPASAPLPEECVPGGRYYRKPSRSRSVSRASKPRKSTSRARKSTGGRKSESSSSEESESSGSSSEEVVQVKKKKKRKKDRKFRPRTSMPLAPRSSAAAPEQRVARVSRMGGTGGISTPFWPAPAKVIRKRKAFKSSLFRRDRQTFCTLGAGLVNDVDACASAGANYMSMEVEGISGADSLLYFRREQLLSNRTGFSYDNRLARHVHCARLAPVSFTRASRRPAQLESKSQTSCGDETRLQVRLEPASRLSSFEQKSGAVCGSGPGLLDAQMMRWGRGRSPAAVDDDGVLACRAAGRYVRHLHGDTSAPADELLAAPPSNIVSSAKAERILSDMKLREFVQLCHFVRDNRHALDTKKKTRRSKRSSGLVLSQEAAGDAAFPEEWLSDLPKFMQKLYHALVVPSLSGGSDKADRSSGNDHVTGRKRAPESDAPGQHTRKKVCL